MKFVYRRYLLADLSNLGLERRVGGGERFLLMAQTFAKSLRVLHPQLLRRLKGCLGNSGIAVRRPSALAESAFGGGDAGSRNLPFLWAVACNHDFFRFVLVGYLGAWGPRY